MWWANLTSFLPVLVLITHVMAFHYLIMIIRWLTILEICQPTCYFANSARLECCLWYSWSRHHATSTWIVIWYTRKSSLLVCIYLSGRTRWIMINKSLSKPFKLECGMPQGSCLGPLLFTLYTSELFEIIKYSLLRWWFSSLHLYLSGEEYGRLHQRHSFFGCWIMVSN